jgi:hypothetical protein
MAILHQVEGNKLVFGHIVNKSGHFKQADFDIKIAEACVAFVVALVSQSAN